MTHSSLEETAEEFDQWAEVGRAESMAEGHYYTTMQMLDRLSLPSDASVLDIGCGNGWLIRELLQRGASKGCGIDISPKMIERAKSQIEFSEREEYKVANAESLDIPDDHFDLISNIESLYYYPNPPKALKEWFRITKKGGYLAIMMDLYLESPATHVWMDALDVSVHLLSKAQIQDDLEKVGWKNVQVFQVQDLREIKTKEQFQTSKYWPSYEQYLQYRETGSLCIIAQKI